MNPSRLHSIVVLAIGLFAVPLSIYVLHQPSLHQIDVLDWARQYAASTDSRQNGATSTLLLVDDYVGQEVLRGRTIVVTGATSGIGAALTRKLVDLGATVVAVGRSSERLQRLVDETGARPFEPKSSESNGRGNVVPIQADFADLKQVAHAVDRIHHSFSVVDMVVANAGMYSAPAAPQGSVLARNRPGYDLIFGVNYLSHVLLVEKLMPLLLRSDRPVVVQVSSLMHFIADLRCTERFGQSSEANTRHEESSSSFPSVFGFGPLVSLSRFWEGHRAYAQSKLAQILFNRAARRRYPRVRFSASCPGWVATNISRGHPAHPVLHALAFEPSQWGISSVLHALFDEESRSTEDDYYINSDATNLFQSQLYDHFLVTASPLASEVVGTATACLSLLFQKLGARQTRTAPSSSLSYNVTLQDQVYSLSLAAVAEWL